MTAHFKHESHGSLGQYLAVFGGLLVLTAISFAVGNSSALREKSPTVMWALMMAVSCAKAMLVILFFMHLKWEANWKYVLTVPATLMSLFLVLMLVPDIGRRTRVYSEERKLHAAEAQAPGQHAAGHDDAGHDHADHPTAAPTDVHSPSTTAPAHDAPSAQPHE